MQTRQIWDPDLYARNARFVSELGAPVVELLAPRPGERILDLGCGDGVLSAKLAAMGCDVIGVDASEAQVQATKKLGVEAQVVDAEQLTFEAAFDAVFSNAALHWMREPDAVIDGVWRALRKNQTRPGSSPRSSWHRRPRREPVVLPYRRGLLRAPCQARFHHPVHRAHPAPYAATG
jgi:trans-aconitate methyltransferase